MEPYREAFSIAQIIKRFLQNDLSDLEKNQLDKWLDADEENRILFEQLKNEVVLQKEVKLMHGINTENAWNIIKEKTENKGKVISIKRNSNNWWIAAASVIIICSAGYLYMRNPTKNSIAKVENTIPRSQNDIAPGGNKAILTLADGSKIMLDSLQTGTISQQGNIKIIKLDEGQVGYQLANEDQNTVQFNTITTPRGGQYQVVLADGSKVWLNAESSITFPTAFIGKERNVEIKGEAYFEVAHNAQMPFNVKVKNMTVQVLGTHFNVNAYDDENWIKTTLLEGSIKVSKGSDSKIIKPGEQAQTENGDNSLIAVQAVDPDEVVAWKNGLFHFNNAGLPEVMHQLSRWYDVDVVYNGPVPKRKFGGEMQRNLKLSQVLELLEKNEVNFKIEGKKIIVMP